ncbi:MAG: hypothetical protein R2751_20105 [Bacteroidales bacterium]
MSGSRGSLDASLESIFSPRPVTYQPRVLVDLQPSEVAGLFIQRPGEATYAFYRDSAGNLGWSVDGRVQPGGVDGPGDESIRRLLSYASPIRFEKKEDEASLRERGVLPDPREWIARLVVTAADGTEHRFEIYPLREQPDGSPDLFKALVRYNDAPGFLLINYLYLDVLMRDPRGYFGPEGPRT